jgi:ubiquinone biosynthesis protein COQ4
VKRAGTEEIMDDVPYLMRGRKEITTESSVLISSSKFLNDARIREWVVSQNLRKAGDDVPLTYGIPTLIQAMRELQDHERIEVLFNEARKDWPELDRWLDERYLANLKKEDLEGYAPDTVGGVFHSYLTKQNLQIDIIPTFEPKSAFEYFFLRGVQIHDFMHILGGVGFDYISETIPAFMKFGNLFRWFNPELAGLLNIQNTFLVMPGMTRTLLHYPGSFMAKWKLAQQGMLIGSSSDALFLHRYEDHLDLTPAQAREKFGVRNVITIDTGRLSETSETEVQDYEAACV